MTEEVTGKGRKPWVAVLLGAFSGGLVVLLLESLGHALFGVVDPEDLASATLPMFASVLVAWTLGSGFGAAVATYWSRARTPVVGTIVGLLLLAGAASNMVVIPHPTWMVFATIVLMPGAAFLTSVRWVRAGRRNG